MNDNDLLQYQAYLKAFCSLSRLFTNTNNPYLEYRAMENIFCKTFNAENLAREDCAFDAKLNNINLSRSFHIKYQLFLSEFGYSIYLNFCE